MRAPSPTRRNSALLIVLLTVQLLMMSGSVRRTDGSTLLESVVLRVTSPVVWVAGSIGGGVRAMLRGIRETWVAREENDHLRREVLDLRERLTRAEERGYEARRLQDLLALQTDLAPESVAAHVVARGDTRQSRVLILDRGADHGIRIDAPVVAWGGAVGRVVYVDRSHAKVLLLSDPNSGIAGMIQRSGAEGLVRGQGDDPLVMQYVSRYQDVSIGDRVVTSGMDGVFPRGFSIGRVMFVNDADQVSMTILLHPAVEAIGLQEVVVLTGERVGPALGPPAREPDR
jgi:rod shape-determining protein MreC